MVALNSHEVTTGLVVYLDPAELITCPGVFTNLKNLSLIPNRPGPFLVLGADAIHDGFLSVPLGTGTGDDGLRKELDSAAKSGPGSGWLDRVSYWHTEHFWIIPAECMVLASKPDMNPVDARKRYDPAYLSEIVDHRDDSPQEFRSAKSK